MFKEHKKILDHFNKFQQEVDRMVTIMGNDAKNHYVNSFYNQGFTDESLEKWQPRKRKEYRTRSGKRVNDTNRGILIKTGDLSRSIRYRKISKYSIVMQSDKPYARIHNEGLQGKAWGKHSFKMPKRQFIGYSGVLNRKLRDKFDRIIKNIFK